MFDGGGGGGGGEHQLLLQLKQQNFFSHITLDLSATPHSSKPRRPPLVVLKGLLFAHSLFTANNKAHKMTERVSAVFEGVIGLCVCVCVCGGGGGGGGEENSQK